MDTHQQSIMLEEPSYILLIAQLLNQGRNPMNYNKHLLKQSTSKNQI